MKKVSIKLVISALITVLVIQGAFGYLGLSAALKETEATALSTAEKSA